MIVYSKEDKGASEKKLSVRDEAPSTGMSAKKEKSTPYFSVSNADEEEMRSLSTSGSFIAGNSEGGPAVSLNSSETWSGWARDTRSIEATNADTATIVRESIAVAENVDGVNSSAPL